MSDEILMDIQRTLGRVEQKIDGHAVSLTQHVADDKVVARALFERIEVLQLGMAQQRGSAKVWSMLAVAAGAILGAVSSFFAGRH